MAHTTLAGLLWDEPPAGYRSNLRTYASRLRRCLTAVDPSRVRLESRKGAANRAEAPAGAAFCVTGGPAGGVRRSAHDTGTGSAYGASRLSPSRA